MEQKQALKLMKMGANVFLTGPAGSGKTFILNKYIKYLKKNKVTIAVTASTGIAATHLNGITIHSWSGIGIKNELSNRDFKNLKSKKYLRERYEKTRVLIIDEVSMLDAERLDLVDILSRSMKNSILPFGGMQVILCGDFFQLPPVNTGSEINKYAFNSSAWKNSELKICHLSEQHRHDDDIYLEILNSIRKNSFKRKNIDLLFERINKKTKSRIKPTKLYTTNKDVDYLNKIELNKLKGRREEYTMRQRCYHGKDKLLEYLVKNCMAPEKLVLAKGAIVMFVKNKFDDKKGNYVNGTLGKVIDFCDATNYPIVKTFDKREIVAHPREWEVEEDEKVVARITQVPLRLAWAITVHKSQGMSLDAAIIDLRDAFSYGMGYVALSRVRTLKGLELKGLNKMSLQVCPEIRELDKELIQESLDNIKILKKISSREIKKREKDFLRSLQWNENVSLFD